MVITCRVSNQLKHVCKGAYGASSALLMFCGNDSWITAGITDAGFGLRLWVRERLLRDARSASAASVPTRVSRDASNTDPNTDPDWESQADCPSELPSVWTIFNVHQCFTDQCYILPFWTDLILVPVSNPTWHVLRRAWTVFWKLSLNSLSQSPT